MRKNRKKYDSARALVIKQLAKNYEVTDSFVRMALRGERDSETADEIKKDYNRLYRAIDTVLK